MNTVCETFSKSLAALFGPGAPAPADAATPATDGETLLLLGDNSLWKDVGGLSSSGAQTLTGSEGGDATRLGTSKGGDQVQICAHCDSRIQTQSKHCPECGALSPWLKKSLDTAFAPFFAPEKEPLDTMRDALSQLCAWFG